MLANLKMGGGQVDGNVSASNICHHIVVASSRELSPTPWALGKDWSFLHALVFVDPSAKAFCM